MRRSRAVPLALTALLAASLTGCADDDADDPDSYAHVADRLLQDRDEWTHEEQVQLREDLHRITAGMERLSAEVAQEDDVRARLERIERCLGAGDPVLADDRAREPAGPAGLRA